MLIKIAGRIRGLFAGNYPENDEEQQPHLNNRGEQIVAQGLPELTEVVRLGDSWQINSTTGQAALTALPTTVAGLTIYNGEPANGKCYAIDSFGSAEEVIDATQTDNTGLFACINKRVSTAPSGGTVESTWISLSGKSAYGGSAVARRGGTIVNDGWTPHGTPGAQMAAAASRRELEGERGARPGPVPDPAGQRLQRAGHQGGGRRSGAAVLLYPHARGATDLEELVPACPSCCCFKGRPPPMRWRSCRTRRMPLLPSVRSRSQRLRRCRMRTMG
jgi:hypothetical protein